MGTGSFIYAVNFAHLGFVGNGIMGPGVLTIFLILKLALSIKYYIKTGRCFSKENSAWRTAQGTWTWINLIPLFGNALTNFLYTVTMTYAW